MISHLQRACVAVEFEAWDGKTSAKGAPLLDFDDTVDPETVRWQRMSAFCVASCMGGMSTSELRTNLVARGVGEEQIEAAVEHVDWTLSDHFTLAMIFEQAQRYATAAGRDADPTRGASVQWAPRGTSGRPCYPPPPDQATRTGCGAA